MTDNLYDIGEKATLSATFRDPKTKVLVDPDVVVCTVQPPESSEQEQLTPKVTKAATGLYEASVSLTRAGRWWYAFDGAGEGESAKERSLTVRAQRVPR